MNCQVCKHSDWGKIYNSTLLQCSNCGFITANMEISSDDLKNLYSEKYFKGEEYLDYKADKTFIQNNFNKRLRLIKKHHCEFSSVLEIGCAYGFFAEIITQKYPKTQYLGLDISEEAIDYAKNFLNQNVQCLDYLTLKTDQLFSDVFMWDVIEHLPEPTSVIKKASAELMVGGHIHITTGDIDALLPRLQKHKWRLIHPPSHLHYFSKKTLSKLLVDSGFEIVSISYPTISRSVRQIFYSLFLLNPKAKNGTWLNLKNGFYKLIPSRLSIPINTFDIMFVTARKIS